MSKPSYSLLVRKYARQYGVDPSLVVKVIQAESSGDPNAVSPKGAQGLMQLMPATADFLGVTDPFDPDQSIEAGTRYLAQLLKQFPDERSAVAAYNWGPGNVAKGTPWPKETKDYVARVLGPLTARVHGQVYQVGEVVRGNGRHAGKVVANIDEATGVPTLLNRVDIPGLVADPDFAAFPLSERLAALRKVGADADFISGYEAQHRPTFEQVTSDPDFSRFSPEAQIRILRKLFGDEVAEAHPAAIVNRLLGVAP